MTMGMRRRFVKRPLPGNRLRTSPKAHSVPTGTAIAVVRAATSRLFQRASRTKNSSVSRRYQ